MMVVNNKSEIRDPFVHFLLNNEDNCNEIGNIRKKFSFEYQTK